MHGNECTMVDSELDVHCDQRIKQRDRLNLFTKGATRLKEMVTDVDEHLAEDCFFAFEMVVQRGPGHSRGGAQRVDGDARKAARSEEFRSYFKQFFAAGRGLAKILALGLAGDSTKA